MRATYFAHLIFDFTIVMYGNEHKLLELLLLQLLLYGIFLSFS
jgi:hypothetical protein